MAITGLDYNLDYITINGILLHDVIEEKVDEKICHITKLSKGTFNGKLLDVVSKIDVDKRIDIKPQIIFLISFPK